MAPVGNEILRAATDAGLELIQFRDADARILRSRIEQTFSPSARRWPLWEATRFPAGVQDPNAWQWIRGFVGNRSCVLLFNPDSESRMFRVSNGSDLDTLLRETSGFEFYISDDDASYLLCFNHHDLLLAAGAAVPWLNAEVLKRRGSDPN